MPYKVENATIDYTKLGVSHTNHGILSFLIGLDYDGAGQGFGQIVLDNYDEAQKKRVPTELGSSLLLAIDELFGVDWEDLKGKPCRSYHSFGNVRAIGHFKKDKWLWFDRKAMAFVVTPFDAIPKTEATVEVD